MESNMDSDSYKTAVYMSICSCTLSIFGSFAIFGSYIFIPNIRNSTRKLVTCLTAADTLTALGYLIFSLAYFAKTKDSVCIPQSVITTYSSLVSFYLTVAIAIHIFATVVFRNDVTSSWKFLVWANIISWFIPGIITGLAGADHVLGKENLTDSTNTSASTVGTGPWCWLNLHHSRHVLWMFLSGKGWEFLCYMITTSLYVLLKFYIYLRHRRQKFTDIHASLRQDDQNYLYVWFVLYLLRLWGSVRSVMYLTGTDTKRPGDKISEILMYIQAFGDPGQAFCHCILFCFLDNTVRHSIFHSCCGTTLDMNLQEERSGLISEISPGNEREEMPNEDENRHDQLGEWSRRYSSFGTTRPDSFTRRVHSPSDNSPRNISVQSDSSKTHQHALEQSYSAQKSARNNKPFAFRANKSVETF